MRRSGPGLVHSLPETGDAVIQRHADLSAIKSMRPYGSVDGSSGDFVRIDLRPPNGMGDGPFTAFTAGVTPTVDLRPAEDYVIAINGRWTGELE